MTVIQTKPILPKKFNPLVYREEFLKAGDATIGDFQKDTDKTEETWTNKSKYNKTIEVKGQSMRFQYWTSNLIRKFIEEGTRKHRIPKTGTSNLSFIWGGPGSYKAKTKRRTVASFPGGPTGTRQHRQFVMHPGTKAMELFKEIRDRRRLSTHSRFRAAMRRANERSGHNANT